MRPLRAAAAAAVLCLAPLLLLHRRGAARAPSPAPAGQQARAEAAGDPSRRAGSRLELAQCIARLPERWLVLAGDSNTRMLFHAITQVRGCPLPSSVARRSTASCFYACLPPLL